MAVLRRERRERRIRFPFESSAGRIKNRRDLELRVDFERIGGETFSGEKDQRCVFPAGNGSRLIRGRR